MSKSRKRLAEMRRNPGGDWTIEDVMVVCRDHGILCEAPRRGSHFTLTLSGPAAKRIGSAGRLTIPARRPIKPVYIREVVKLIDAVLHLSNETE